MTDKEKFGLILDFVSKKTGIDAAAIIGKARRHHYAVARFAVCYLSRKEGLSFPYIGELLNRDHTTIIYAFKKSESSPDILKIASEYNINGGKPRKVRRVKFRGRYAFLHAIYENEKCIVCGFDEITEVHHIVPQSHGGTDEPDNLVLLCPNHHALADRGMIHIKDVDKIIKDKKY